MPLSLILLFWLPPARLRLPLPASVQARLLLLIALVFMPPLIFMLLTINTGREQAQAQARTDLLRTTTLVAEAHRRNINNARTVLAAIAQFPEVQSGDTAACSARLAQMVALYPDYAGFGVSNLEGVMYCTSAPVPGVIRIADRLWFREAVRTRAFAIGEYQITRPPPGVPSVGLGYPVLDDANRLLGVVSHGLRLDELSEITAGFSLPDDATLYLADHNGVVLVRQPDNDSWQGQPLPSPLRETVLSSGSGSVEVTDANGVKKVYAYTPVERSSVGQIYLSIGRSQAVLYGAAQASAARDFSWLGLLALLTLGVTWVGSQRLIVRPVSELTDVTQQLTAGNLNARAVQYTGDGELERLALTFNQMADTVQQRQADQERVKAELLERERHLHLALETARMVAWTWDPHRNQIQTTHNFADIYGLLGLEYAEQGFALVHPNDRERHRQTVMRSVTERRPYHSEFRIIRPDTGQTVILDERAVPVLDEAGHLQKLAGVVIDITERKAAEEALRDADRRKDEFLATLAHELRNPLAPIRNAVQLLSRKGPLDPTVQRARDMIDRQVQHLVRLVDDLLDVSRITRGRLELRRSRVDLASVVAQALETSRPHIEQAGHEFTLSLPPAPIYLDADAVRLAQVFSNLLNNACKYCEPGGKIGLTATRQGGGVIVTVKDNGVGIPPDKLDSVFEMFAQVDSSLTRSQDGLGIGLTLVKELVRLHGGSVEAISAGLGQGSEFSVRLPLLADPPQGETVPAPLSGVEDTRRRRILIVDDNKDITLSLAELLAFDGHETYMAYDGLEAVTAAEQFHPDLVLLDIGLPKLNGYDVCRRIREHPWSKGMVMVALTGWGQDEDRRKAHEAGFDYHLVKPVEYSVLAELLAGRR